MKIKKVNKFVVGVVAAVLVLTGCSGAEPATPPDTDVSDVTGTGGFADCGESPNTCNGGEIQQGGNVVYAIEEPVTSWNLSRRFTGRSVMSGILPAVFEVMPDLTVQMNNDLVESVDTTEILCSATE